MSVYRGFLFNYETEANFAVSYQRVLIEWFT